MGLTTLMISVPKKVNLVTELVSKVEQSLSKEISVLTEKTKFQEDVENRMYPYIRMWQHLRLTGTPPFRSKSMKVPI